MYFSIRLEDSTFIKTHTKSELKSFCNVLWETCRVIHLFYHNLCRLV